MSKFAPFISIVLAVVAVFYAGITPSFSSDDYVHLLNNTHFKNTLDALSVFTEPYGREYRPMVRISLWLNHLMGSTAIPFKATNLVLHLLTTFLIYRILNKLKFSPLAATLATATFALHPIHVTSIHFILGRTDLVAAVFYFGTLALVAEWKSTVSIREYISVSLTFIAALASKEMSVTLCLMMLLIVFYNQQIKNTRSLISAFIKLSPFFAITFVYAMVRILMWNKLASDVTVYINYSASHVVSNYLTWFFALLYPFDLYRAQDLMIESPFVAFLVVVFCVLIIICGLLIIYGRTLFSICKSFWLWAGLIWICVTLLPICGGNPHRWYLYIPSFGISLFLAAAVDATDQHKQKILIPIIGLLLAIYSIEVFRLSTIWNKQSVVATELLKQIEVKKIYMKERIYFANIPFGYESAYLFTISSLQEAMQYNFGQSPVVVAVSYVNLSDDRKISSSIESRNINFKIDPNHYNFFLLSATERRFDNPEVREKEKVLIKINAIAKNKKISDYTVTIPEGEQSNFYYFDGNKINSFPSTLP